jgi:nicotinamidase-related amidase
MPQYCVSATAKDAKRLGYIVYVLKDCVGTADRNVDIMENLFFEFTQNGISIINSKEYFKSVSKNN